MSFLNLEQLPFIGMSYEFVNSGTTVLRQIDIHASPRFIQTNLA